MTLASCRALAPDFLCVHGDMLIYLLPSIALALVIRILAAVHPAFFLLTAAGTICHELAHVVAGLLTGAAPSHFTVIPRRKGRHWELGSVTLTRVRWYNAAPAALAPLCILFIPLAVAWFRTRPGWHFQPVDLILAFLLAPQMLSFWPSRIDWVIALRSWPYLLIIAAVASVIYYFFPHMLVWRRP